MPNRAPRRYKGHTVSQRTERIAAWLVAEFVKDPFMPYGKRLERTCARWGCADKTAKRAIQAAHEIIMEQRTPELASFVALAAKDIYQEARAKGDGITALRALDRLSRLHGLDKATKVEHSGTVARLDLANLSDDELEEELSHAQAVEKRARERS